MSCAQLCPVGHVLDARASRRLSEIDGHPGGIEIVRLATEEFDGVGAQRSERTADARSDLVQDASLWQELVHPEHFKELRDVQISQRTEDERSLVMRVGHGRKGDEEVDLRRQRRVPGEARKRLNGALRVSYV